MPSAGSQWLLALELSRMAAAPRAQVGALTVLSARSAQALRWGR